ncbi:MAG: CRTAC1 family protein, partial [Planctomycetes bacterium]|nr:CRTAC1 family protein [Planctomycetota bacterium]
PTLFEDVAATVGLPTEAAATRLAFGDLDSDGYCDIVLDRTNLWFNRPTDSKEPARRFVLAPLPICADGQRRPDVVLVGDLDNDGVADLFLGRNTDLSNPKFKDDQLRHEIWMGDGKGGYQLKRKSGVEDFAETIISACLVDFDRDGNLDLFLANAYTAYGKSYEAFPDRLLRGRGDGRFLDVTKTAGLEGVAKVGLETSRRPSYGVTHTDWNNDGWQDLLTMSYGRQANRLWRNDGDGTFTDVGAATTFDGDDDRSGEYPAGVRRAKEPEFRSHGNDFDCAVADFDGDGDMDCFLATIAHGWGGPASDSSMLLVNEGADKGFVFRREKDRIPREPLTLRTNRGDLHAGWLDVDNDGWLDLLIASSDYPDQQILRLYHQSSEGQFEEWTDRLGLLWVSPAQISLGDFDHDGATDILVGRSHQRLSKEQRLEHPMRPGLLRNLCAPRSGNRFLNIRLQGKKGSSNRDAIGARVTIWTGDHRQTREVQGGLGVGAHRDDLDCRFGLGQADEATRVEVRWPDRKGTVQVFEHVKANTFYTLAQGEVLQQLAP